MIVPNIGSNYLTLVTPTPENFDRFSGQFFQGEWPMKKLRRYKYDWWIHTRSTPLELLFPDIPQVGYRVHIPQTRMSTFDAMLMARDLSDRFETYFIYNRKGRRLDPETPWYNTLKRQGGSAPRYNDDTDRPWRGHK